MDSEAEASFVPDFELTDVVNEYKLLESPALLIPCIHSTMHNPDL